MRDCQNDCHWFTIHLLFLFMSKDNTYQKRDKPIFIELFDNNVLKIEHFCYNVFYRETLLV